MKHMSLSWERSSDGPYLSPQEGTLAPTAVTTPDLVFLNNQLTLLAGAVADKKERIISVSMDESDLVNSNGPSLVSASILVDTGPLDFDCDHVYDPAAVNVGGQVCVFYSAIGKGPDRIGQAVSKGGRKFTKIDHPICLGRSPEVVDHEGKLYLFYVLKTSQMGYRIQLSISEDLRTFHTISAKPALDAGRSDQWDSYEVTTPRIFKRNLTYYMIYAGGCSPDRQDLPMAFGLARSQDLIRWEKYPDNPVFGTGRAGQWDDGAIWFGTVFEWKENLYLLYEGGRLTDITQRAPGLTQLGLARLACTDFDRALADW
jgi:hypothetical protein